MRERLSDVLGERLDSANDAMSLQRLGSVPVCVLALTYPAKFSGIHTESRWAISRVC